jgi:hypothetical protein
MACANHAPQAAPASCDHIGQRDDQRPFFTPSHEQRHHRIEMCAADRPQCFNQYIQGKYSCKCIAQKRNGSVALGQLLGHDARAYNDAEQYRSAHAF